MGRIVTPKYRVEYVTRGSHFTPGAWRGRVSEKALRAHVESLNASLVPGGANEHIGRAYPDTKVLAATIVRQADSESVAQVANEVVALSVRGLGRGYVVAGPLGYFAGGAHLWVDRPEHGIEYDTYAEAETAAAEAAR